MNIKFKIIFFILFSPVFLVAQEVELDKEKRNELAFFIGAASSSENTAFTIGFDYQYRFNNVFGLGFQTDYVTGEFNSFLIGPAAYLHAGNFEFAIVPAIEFSEDELIGVFRIGVGYEIELPRLAISPTIYFDSERNLEYVIVYGVSFIFKL